jgi:S-adenosylmethionine hydrolase
MFEAAGKKSFTAIVSSNRPLKITRYHTFYYPNETEIFLVNNHLGFIEITLFNGNIAAIADIITGTPIEIQFH